MAAEVAFGPRIEGSLQEWRQQNPDATVANIQGRRDLTDADFVHLKGIHTLNMGGCSQAGITDGAFVHLKGIHTLVISNCTQAGITDGAFVHLKGIQELYMAGCTQVGITDGAFVHLKGIHTLNMSRCTQAGITDGAFAHLEGIHTLIMIQCRQAGITGKTLHQLGDNLEELVIHSCNDQTINNANQVYGVTERDEVVKKFEPPSIEGSLQEWRQQNPYATVANIEDRKDLIDADFIYLRGIKWLNMSKCNQDDITDAAFSSLKGIHKLNMAECKQPGISNEAFVNLKGIHTLNMMGCSQAGITNQAFVHLKGIHTLKMSRCSQRSITDAAFVHLKGIHTLNMAECNRRGITDAAFVHLKGIHTLNMMGCWQAGITDRAFVHLKGIHTLNMAWCNQEGITDGAFVHLQGIHTLNMSHCMQAGITDGAFVHLKGIHELHMTRCSQAGITDGAFVYLKGIHTLDMNYCNQAGITDGAFVHLKGIHTLIMSWCTQASITGQTLYQLGDKIKYLDVSQCNPQTIENAEQVYGVRNYDSAVKFYKPPEPPEPAEMWKGFTQTDMKLLNTIFQEDAINHSVCPICLVYSQRTNGCMYVLGHICNKNARHEKLYQKYKNSEGIIEWCTICSRISFAHHHYELDFSFNKKPELSTYPLSAFANDCRPSGGGFPEKLARFRRLREYALKLQGDIDTKTKKQALNELVEEVWNAPLHGQENLLKNITNRKEWNIPTNRFPENMVPKNTANAPNAPNIPFPLNGKLPVLDEHGNNNIAMEYNIPVLIFNHKQNDGNFKTHGIKAESLKDFIENSIKDYTIETFGRCFAVPDCNAKIHPQEIKDHVPEELYNEYKRRYNNKFYEKPSKNKPTMVGGAENIFKEATDVECYIPINTSDGGRRKMTRRRKYLKTRKNKGGKQKYRKTRK